MYLLWRGRKFRSFILNTIIFTSAILIQVSFDFFNWFSQFVLCCRFSFATFFMYLIVNFLTSCFKTFHFNWCLKRYSFLLEKVLISVISFCSVVKELSNFQNQNPLPLIVVFFFWKKEEYRRMICWNRRQYLCHGYKSLKSIRN